MLPVDELTSLTAALRESAASLTHMPHHKTDPSADASENTRFALQSTVSAFFQQVPCTLETTDIHQSLMRLHETAGNMFVPSRFLCHEIDKTIAGILSQIPVEPPSPSKSQKKADLVQLCKECIPSYRIAPRSKPRIQAFYRYCKRKAEEELEEESFEREEHPIDVIRAESGLASKWLEWVGKRPRPMHVRAFLDDFASEESTSENNLMNEVNVYFHLTPTTRKQNSMHTSLLASIHPKPLSKPFRARIQFIVEELAASFDLQTKRLHRFAQSDTTQKGAQTSLKTRMLSPEASAVLSLLEDTAKEVRKQHYEARMYDEVHFQHEEECRKLRGRNPAKPADSVENPEFLAENASFVFTLPASIKAFVEWLKPGPFTSFLLHWLLLCAFKLDKRVRRPYDSDVFSKSLLKAAKSWASEANVLLHSFKSPNVGEGKPALALLPEGVQLFRKLLSCAAAFHEAERLGFILGNLREAGVTARRGPHDAQSLLESHEKIFANFVSDRAQSRHLTRISSENSPNVYKDVPAEYTSEAFAPALLKAHGLRRALLALEETILEKEMDASISESHKLTNRVLCGIQAFVGDPMGIDSCIRRLVGVHAADVCLVHVEDLDVRNRWLDVKNKPKRNERDDVPWDAVVGEAVEEESACADLHGRFDRCGYASVVLRLESVAEDEVVTEEETNEK